MACHSQKASKNYYNCTIAGVFTNYATLKVVSASIEYAFTQAEIVRNKMIQKQIIPLNTTVICSLEKQ